VEYTIQFELATASTNLEGIVVDICSGNTSPLIGTACSLPTSFSWQAAPTIVSAFIGADDVSGWTEGTLNSNRTLTLTDATGVATAASDVVTIVVSGVANPSDVDVVAGGNQVGTFYGRVLTYNDSAEVANYAPGNGPTGVTGLVDFGGVALSTTNELTVNARVQESLTFCIYTNSPQTSCASATDGDVNIPNSTTPLDSGAVQTASAYFGLASNALSGVNVRMWSNNSSNGVLKSGSTFTINPFGGTMDGSGNPLTGTDDACTADSGNSATEQFGMRIAPGSGVTASAPYNCSAGNHGWDNDSAAGAGANDTTTVGSAYGDTVATTTGATGFSESQMEFAAKSALTTEAGIYTSDLNFIATGTY
jgi:hypothetical protein